MMAQDLQKGAQKAVMLLACTEATDTAYWDA